MRCESVSSYCSPCTGYTLLSSKLSCNTLFVCMTFWFEKQWKAVQWAVYLYQLLYTLCSSDMCNFPDCPRTPSSPSALCDTLVACKYKYIHICMYFMCHVFVTNIRLPSGIWWACCTCCCCWCLGFAATICGLRKMFLLSLCALLIDFPCENTESCCCLWYF